MHVENAGHFAAHNYPHLLNPENTMEVLHFDNRHPAACVLFDAIVPVDFTSCTVHLSQCSSAPDSDWSIEYSDSVQCDITHDPAAPRRCVWHSVALARLDRSGANTAVWRPAGPPPSSLLRPFRRALATPPLPGPA
jgi:hypothetical protein